MWDPLSTLTLNSPSMIWSLLVQVPEDLSRQPTQQATALRSQWLREASSVAIVSTRDVCLQKRWSNVRMWHTRLKLKRLSLELPAKMSRLTSHSSWSAWEKFAPKFQRMTQSNVSKSHWAWMSSWAMQLLKTKQWFRLTKKWSSLRRLVLQLEVDLVFPITLESIKLRTIPRTPFLILRCSQKRCSWSGVDPLRWSSVRHFNALELKWHSYWEVASLCPVRIEMQFISLSTS